MENSIPGSGHSFAARAAAASLTPTAALREEWNGMTQVQTIQQVCRLDDQGMAALAQNFAAIAATVFVADRAAIAITAEDSAHKSMAAPLASLLAALPKQGTAPQDSPRPFVSRASATGWHHNLPVAYVSRVFRTVPYTHPDAPALMVMAKLLRSEFLHREVREKGGAYGGMAGYNSDGGLFSMLSYRDPHLERTLDVYQQAIKWACQGNFSDDVVKESILTVFADLDRPLSPGSRGYREFIHQQQGLSHEMLQNFRDRILAVDQKQLAHVAQAYLDQGYSSSSVGVLAGDEMFSKAEKTLQRINMQMKRLGGHG